MSERIQKTAGETIEPTFEAARILETVWRAGRFQSTSDYVRPLRANGFEFECTTGGQTGRSEPRWPIVVGGTVVDGSVTWTARAFATNATDTIDTVTIDAETGITVGAAQVSGTEISFQISGGTAGQHYLITLVITTAAGEVLRHDICVEVIRPSCP